MQTQQNYDLLKYAGLVYAMMPDKSFVSTRQIHDHNSNYFTFEMIVNQDESYFIRTPTTQDTLPKLEASITTTKILNKIASEKGVLPFRIPKYIAEKPVVSKDGTALKIVIMEPFWGQAVAVNTLNSDQTRNVAHILADVHSLDLKYIENAGLPTLTNTQIKNSVENILSKISQTGKLPVSLVEKWENLISDNQVWNFKTTVIHGHMMPHQILFQGDEISYVQGWHSLQISDPAYDLAAIIPGLDIDKTKTFFDDYFRTIARRKHISLDDVKSDRYIEKRAEFYAQFETAKSFLLALEHNDKALEAELLDELKELNEKLELREALNEEEFRKLEDQRRKEQMLRQREIQDGLKTEVYSAEELGGTSRNNPVVGANSATQMQESTQPQTQTPTQINQDLQETAIFDDALYSDDSDLENDILDNSASLETLVQESLVQENLSQEDSNNENPVGGNIDLSKYVADISDENNEQ